VKNIRSIYIVSYLTAFFTISLSAQTTHPELVVQVGHNEEVKSVAISHNGKFFVSGSSDGRASIWDAQAGAQLRIISGQIDKIYAVAISPDDTILATGARDGSVVTWDIATGKQIVKFQLPGFISSLTFDPGDGDLIVACKDRSVTTWNPKTGTKLTTLSGHTGTVTSVAVGSDGKLIVSGSEDHTIRLWDAASGKEVAILENQGQVISVAISPDGRYVTGGLLGGEISVWGVNDRKLIRTIKADRFVVDSVAFSPDGKLLASGNSTSSVSLWDVASGDQVGRLSYPDDELITNAYSVVFSPDGRSVIAGYRNGRITTWDIQTKSVSREVIGRSYPVWSISTNSAGTLLGSNAHHSMKLWSLTSSTGLQNFSIGKDNSNYSVALRGDGSMIASYGGDGISLWDVKLGDKIRDLGRGETAVFSPDGTTLVKGNYPGGMRLTPFGVWDANTGEQLKSFQWFDFGIRALAFSANGNSLASYGDFDPDDGIIKLWDVASRKELWTVGHQNRTTKAFAFSPDGQTLACAIDDGTIVLRSTKDGATVNTLKGHFDDVNSVAFSPDGKLLASGSRDGTIVLWDTRSWQNKQTLTGHGSFVNSVLFTPDGKFVFSGSTDSTIRLWDVATGKEMADLVAFGDDDWAVVTPDGLFDGTPAAWKYLLWRYRGNTFEVTPVEAYFNDFYYPGLLSDIVAGKMPKAKISLNNIDRRQLKVGLSTNEQTELGRTGDTHTIRVNIEVEESPDTDTISEMAGRGSKWWPIGGARDLRLFRNGSLVKLWSGDLLAPNKDGCKLQSRPTSQAPRKAICTASLPIVAGENNLTAYAFNKDNVKSTDATLTVRGADSLKRKGTAYVLAIGVNEYANNQYNLTYAVPDSKDFSDELKRQQEKLGNFDHVEVVSLNDANATKANILKALSDISAKVQPEDSLTIYFAGHGTAEGNRFYLIPHDLGYTGQRDKLDEAGLKAILSHGISDEELETAVEGIDAGQMLLVIDACNSGQALEAEEKRRGPMNSKGLAQLAYEKGMYILTAAQSYQAAKEAAKLGHGFLTYALVEEGLKTPAADKEPKDGQVLVREWLDFATQRVPQMQEDDLKTRELTRLNGQANSKPTTDDNIQRPRVFYRREAEPHPMVVARP